MRSRLILSMALTALLMSASDARAQKATEQFIPLGQSPGLSSVIGQIGSVDRATQVIVITVETASGGQPVQVTEQTRIWIDRSTFSESNVAGGFDDLKTGRQIEVKYQDDERRENAEWIKVVPERDG
jgi:hypothetical protein